MIRPATGQEIESIVLLTRACARKMIDEGIFQWNEHYPNPGAFEQDLERGELYVMILEDRLAGCITVSTLKDKEYEPIEWLTPDGGNYYIHRLAIHPDFQHRGLARELMDFAEAYVVGMEGRSVRLDTFSQNTRNQRFYENRGYQRLGNIYFPKQSEHPFYCYELVL